MLSRYHRPYTLCITSRVGKGALSSANYHTQSQSDARAFARYYDVYHVHVDHTGRTTVQLRPVPSAMAGIARNPLRQH